MTSGELPAAHASQHVGPFWIHPCLLADGCMCRTRCQHSMSFVSRFSDHVDGSGTMHGSMLGKAGMCMPYKSHDGFTMPWCVSAAAGERRLLDIARVNLGAARSALRLPDYKKMVWGDMDRLLAWKCSRQPF